MCESLFRVVEYFSGFAVEHIPTGKEHWMSDGVDAVFDENDEPLSPGSEGFCEAWAKGLNETSDDTLEAYFPELLEV